MNGLPAADGFNCKFPENARGDMMNYSFLAIPLVVILALSALAEAQRDDERHSIPALKVWYAGKTQKWPLADYEIKRLKDNM